MQHWVYSVLSRFNRSKESLNEGDSSKMCTDFKHQSEQLKCWFSFSHHMAYIFECPIGNIRLHLNNNDHFFNHLFQSQTVNFSISCRRSIAIYLLVNVLLSCYLHVKIVLFFAVRQALLSIFIFLQNDDPKVQKQ